MRAYLVVLLLIPSVVAGQQSATLAGPVSLEIHSADTTRVLLVSVDMKGRLFGALGIPRPAAGTVDCGPTGCTATTPAVLELTQRPGSGRLSIADTTAELEITVIAADNGGRRTVARGHTVSFSRTDSGDFRIIAPRVATHF